MAQDAPGGDGDDEAGRAFLLDPERVRLELRAAGYEVWTAFAALAGQRWDSPAVGHAMAARLVRSLGDLAGLRCAPDGRPLPAPEVFDCLLADVSRDGRTPRDAVERFLVRELAGMPRSGRTAAEVAGLAEAFFRRFAADCGRGGMAWVDELHALVGGGGVPGAGWTLEVPRAGGPAGDDGAVALRIPVAALEAAGLAPGDRLVVEPRARGQRGLWIGLAPGPADGRS